MHILTSTLQLWACAKTRTLGKCNACHHSTIENYYQSRKSEGSFKQNTILIFILHLTNQTYSKVVQRWAQIQLIFFFNIPSKMIWRCLEMASSLTSGMGPTSHSFLPGWTNSECECGPTEHPASLQESKAAHIPACTHMCRWHSQETREPSFSGYLVVDEAGKIGKLRWSVALPVWTGDFSLCSPSNLNVTCVLYNIFSNN